VTRIFLLVLLSQILVPLSVVHARSSEIFAAQVKWVRCYDGDTCTFKVYRNKFKARIAGIDAPELKQAYGVTSRNAMSEVLARARTIQVECRGRSYDRKVCAVHADGKDVAALLVERGLAHDAPRYSKGKYKKEEELARVGRKGLWASEAPQNPRCFRHPTSKGC
jgi:micrococcal nuclease